MKVMLDPGHGGVYSGAVGSIGVPEKAINLSVALQMAGLLGMNDLHQVHLTRYTDTALDPHSLSTDLARRCTLANDWGADVFCSIHCNSWTAPAAQGFEVWTNPEADEADRLAGLMWYRFRSTFPDMKGRADFSDGDPDKQSQFTVLVGTVMPAVLFELAFISNPQDQDRLLHPGWQAMAADCLVEAIREWANG